MVEYNMEDALNTHCCSCCLAFLTSNVPISDELVIGPGKGSSHVLILVDRSEQQGEVWCSVTELL